MRKIIYSILILGTITCGTSCGDFLDVENKTSTNANGFVTSYDSAFSTLATCYAKLGTGSDGLMGEERFRNATDIFESWGTFQSFTWDANDTEVVRPLWKKYYKFISDANFAIKTIEENADVIDKTFTESLIEDSDFIEKCTETNGFSASKMLIGEAKVLRAYAYFTLYRYFGGVPIVDALQEKGAKFIPRATRDELFSFIEQDLREAIKYCSDSADGTLYGRVSKSSAAGLLAKCYVFQASYIRRAEFAGEQINEEAGNLSKESLYKSAISLCDTLINKKIGKQELVDFYPAVFKTRNNEMLLCFDGKAAEGQGSSYSSAWGIGGNGDYGARGSNSTSMHPIMYDYKMWESEGSARKLFMKYGAISYRNFTSGDDPYKELEELGTFTHTGDSTRRMWNVAKLFITGPTTPNLPAGLWCLEPSGSTLGPEFFIEPGKGEDNYTET
ncbi:MAG: RagB/SusD family nutrient uptake outer membrane protein, partial [Bacteroidales bacterium]|nr:RagB/SusD family nutrient uptake outer membrane protein [Bacteroidales bacterium]